MLTHSKIPSCGRVKDLASPEWMPQKEPLGLLLAVVWGCLCCNAHWLVPRANWVAT